MKEYLKLLIMVENKKRLHLHTANAPVQVHYHTGDAGCLVCLGWPHGGSWGLHLKETAGLFCSSLQVRVATSRFIMKMERTIIMRVLSVSGHFCKDIVSYTHFWQTIVTVVWCLYATLQSLVRCEYGSSWTRTNAARRGWAWDLSAHRMPVGCPYKLSSSCLRCSFLSARHLLPEQRLSAFWAVHRISGN